MAYLEVNALSVILCGSFRANVYLPEMDKLDLTDERHEKKYPVLWLLHSEGGSSMDWNKTMAERCAAEFGIFIVAPDAQHSLCSNMEYGPQYEEFLSKELPGIIRNNLPTSEKAEENWIGGVGTGAYGAVKAAIKHPEVFSKCIALDGIFDMEQICCQAMEGGPTDIFHTEESLKAVFGDLQAFSGSGHDIYALAGNCREGEFYIAGTTRSVRAKERQRLAECLKEKACYVKTEGEIMDFGEPAVLRDAIKWLLAEK